MRAVVLVVLAAGCGRIGFDEVARASDAPGGSADATIDATVCSRANFDSMPSYLSLFGSGMTEFNGTLRCTISGTPGEAAGVQTAVQSFDGRSMAMHVLQAGTFPDALTGPGWHYTSGSVHLFINQGTVRYENNLGVVSTVPYVPATHAWLRLRHAGSEIVAETSPDGTTWTSHGTSPVDTLDMTFLDLGIDADSNLPGQDVAVIDDLVICPPL